MAEAVRTSNTRIYAAESRSPRIGKFLLVGSAIGLIFAGLALGAHLGSPIKNVKWINSMAKQLTKVGVIVLPTALAGIGAVGIFLMMKKNVKVTLIEFPLSQLEAGINKAKERGFSGVTDFTLICQKAGFEIPNCKNEGEGALFRNEFGRSYIAAHKVYYSDGADLPEKFTDWNGEAIARVKESLGWKQLNQIKLYFPR